MEKKRWIVQVVLDPRTYRFLSLAAKSEDRTMSAMARILLKEGLTARVRAGGLQKELEEIRTGTI